MVSKLVLTKEEDPKYERWLVVKHGHMDNGVGLGGEPAWL